MLSSRLRRPTRAETRTRPLETCQALLACETAIPTICPRSGLTPSGVDLGSGSVRAIPTVRPLVVVGDGVSSYESGEVWHYLDARLGLAAALVEAGVQRVVIGAVDPDPRHRRAGIDLLEAAGLDVLDGVLASKCDELYAPFRKALQLDRPWMLCKWAMTLDGKTAAPTGEARWISGPEARTKTHALRAHCDGVMVGFRTAQIDDPELTVRHVEGKQPVRIVIDPLGEIDDDSNLVRTAHQAPTWLLASEDVDPRRSGHLQDLGVQVLHIPTAEGPRRLHLGRAFKELRRRGLRPLRRVRRLLRWLRPLIR